MQSHLLTNDQSDAENLEVAVAQAIAACDGEPREAVECTSANATIRSAERMARTDGHIGAVAFSRTGDPASGEFADAVLLKTFGDVPSDLSAL